MKNTIIDEETGLEIVDLYKGKTMKNTIIDEETGLEIVDLHADVDFIEYPEGFPTQEEMDLFIETNFPEYKDS